MPVVQLSLSGFCAICVLAIAAITGPALHAVDVITIHATVPTATETGTQPGRFTISRSGSAGALTVFLDSSTGTATPGGDYTAIPASVVIPDGVLTLAVSVVPVQDGSAEGGESVVVAIQNVSDNSYIVGNPFSALVTIADDDMTASVRVPQLLSY
nr:hypothetical protein [Planctomycetota bacterium]